MIVLNCSSYYIIFIKIYLRVFSERNKIYFWKESKINIFTKVTEVTEWLPTIMVINLWIDICKILLISINFFFLFIIIACLNYLFSFLLKVNLYVSFIASHYLLKYYFSIQSANSNIAVDKLYCIQIMKHPKYYVINYKIVVINAFNYKKFAFYKYNFFRISRKNYKEKGNR